MTLVRIAEKLAGTYHEGPEPPARLTEQVVAFLRTHPRATAGDWAEFAARAVRSAYQSGFRRGHEWRERGLAEAAPDSPERRADAERHDWPWHAGVPTTDELRARVPPGGLDEQLARLPNDAARAAALDAVGRASGGFRVAVVVGPRRTAP